ncbi:MAG: S-methyl-5'-thioadenosine phosphorylase [Thermoanaerobaculia bacterium]|nr:S-methyl-5'-thioadenosine phosphorylase [Thermoanaerobaculia bacterium]MBP9825892.1 S-methyl-5'-thioadenosine phosphorylase [Thermoanaerobaculia bacterium]
MSDVRIGVIGGSGLYEMAGLEVEEERRIETPWGAPSDAFILGNLDGRKVVFLARHGRGHRLLPTELNFRANVYGFKTLGVEFLISVSAVGSLKEEYVPGHIVVPDQFYDRTRHRPDTFFGNGIVAHVSIADPVSKTLAAVLADSAEAEGATIHRGGCYVNMEGPTFSTRAESHAYRQMGFDIIGMTNLQEAKLSREAEIAYASLSMVTDYDCWREEEEHVTGEGVMEVLRKNVALAQRVVRRAIGALGPEVANDCADALAMSLITDPGLVPADTLQALEPLLGKYLDRTGGKLAWRR